MHSALIIIEPKATKVRELLTTIQLSHLSTIELTAAQVLSIGMESSTPYKEIYQNIKNALVGFSAIKCRVLDS